MLRLPERDQANFGVNAPSHYIGQGQNPRPEPTEPHLNSIYEDAKKSHPPKVARSIVGNKMAKYTWHMLTKCKLYRYRDDKKYKQKLARLKPKI